MAPIAQSFEVDVERDSEAVFAMQGVDPDLNPLTAELLSIPKVLRGGIPLSPRQRVDSLTQTDRSRSHSAGDGDGGALRGAGGAAFAPRRRAQCPMRPVCLYVDE